MRRWRWLCLAESCRGRMTWFGRWSFCAHNVNKSSGPVFDEYLHPASRRNVLSSHLKRGFVSAAACRCCCCCLCCCRHGWVLPCGNSLCSIWPILTESSQVWPLLILTIVYWLHLNAIKTSCGVNCYWFPRCQTPFSEWIIGTVQPVRHSHCGKISLKHCQSFPPFAAVI